MYACICRENCPQKFETKMSDESKASSLSTSSLLSPPNDNDYQTKLLQQICQQRRFDLLIQFQRAQLAMQHMNYFQAIHGTTNGTNVGQNEQNIQTLPQNFISQLNSLNSVDTSEDSDNQQFSPTSKENFCIKTRRALPGSGQTISQLTKDRLKNMITTKMNRSRADSNVLISHSSQSSSVTGSGVLPSSSAINSGCAWNNNLDHSTSQKQMIASINAPTSSPHFEPYPIPSTVHASHSGAALPSIYQLRKVNSEPNLKMRIRAKLLSKGSSPIQMHHSSAFTFPLRQNLSNDGDFLMDTGFGSNVSVEQQQSSPLFANAPHLIIPSPSLPNLTSSLQMDMSVLLAQAAHSPFFSMPSLQKTNLLATPPISIIDSILDPVMSSEANNRQSIKMDLRTFYSPIPLGGYPSLLKQQLRDLVLRRKSLVREEPEDEAALDVSLLPRTCDGLSLSSDSADTIILKTGLVYDSLMAKHQCVCGNNNNHVEHGGRVQSIWATLIESGLVDKCERINSRKASLDMLKMAHSPTYVTFFAVSPTACLKMEPTQLPVKSFVQLPCGGIGVDSDTYFNDASTQIAARLAAGCLIELVSQVAEGKVRNGFACIRPPGHHSEYDQAMGFCFFNNVSIAAKYLQHRFQDSYSRIAIIDWDVHHGNGTQLFFESDPSVLYISLHRHDNGNFFPGTGAVTEVGTGAGKGFTVNIPFCGEIMGDCDYLAAWRVVVIPILEQYNPNFILVSAGFDAALGHSQALGGYQLSPQIFGHFTRQLMNFADGRIVLALEGGYDLPSMCECALECVKSLCDNSSGTNGKLSEEALTAIPKQNAQDAIQKVIAIHKRFWPCLASSQGIGMSELHWQTMAQRFATLTV